MEIGKNTYISLEEANSYIEKHYLSTDPFRVKWEAMNDDDKKVCLLNGARAIDSLVLLGKRVKLDQEMEFPRIINKYNTGIPDKVKYAQVETALASADEVTQNRQELINAGVVSYRIGDLSETYGARSNLSADSKLFNSSKAIQYLVGYIGGTYNVR